MEKIGTLYIIAAPSGTGKTTLVNALVQSISDIQISISHTTRQKRPAEIDGTHYYFMNKSSFEKMITQNAFLEYANVFEEYYGTSRQWVEKTLAAGIDVILEIDWQGCEQIQTLLPECISIFILPPSLKILAERLTTRAQDSLEVIEKRLADARVTLSHLHQFKYVVINADFDKAVHDLKCIVQANRLLQKNQPNLIRQFSSRFI